MGRPRGKMQTREQKDRRINGAGKVIGYIRVSTTGQGLNGHSLDGQRTRLEETAAREGLQIVDIVSDVESGAKERDGLAAVQARIMAGEAQGILFPKIDRLGRSMYHLLKIVDWAVTHSVDLLAADEGWQVRDGKKVDKMLPFRLAMAEVELERIRERTREGLRAAKAKGVRLGHPLQNTELADRATELRRTGMTFQAIADLFNGEGHTTSRGAKYTGTQIFRMVNWTDPTANPIGGYRKNLLAAPA